MSTPVMTLDQIRMVGLDALSQALGPVGLIRFLQQFEIGYGDYSKERHIWLDELDVQSIVAEIWAEREPNTNS